LLRRHRFGRGEYKYFSYPLPAIVAALRTALYERLAPIANRWNDAMGNPVRYPPRHAQFLRRCHDAGQERPTPQFFCNTASTTITACTRISMANTCFRCR
jgi:hypothetical protein